MKPPPLPVPPENRTASLIGQGMGMLLAVFCVAVTAWLLYDIAYVVGSGNDWGDLSLTDLFFIWVVNVPGWIVALCLATFIGRVRRFPAILTYLLFAVELALLTQKPAAFRLRDERRQKRSEEITRQIEKDVEETLRESKKASPAATPTPVPTP